MRVTPQDCLFGQIYNAWLHVWKLNGQRSCRNSHVWSCAALRPLRPRPPPGPWGCGAAVGPGLGRLREKGKAARPRVFLSFLFSTLFFGSLKKEAVCKASSPCRWLVSRSRWQCCRSMKSKFMIIQMLGSVKREEERRKINIAAVLLINER